MICKRKPLWQSDIQYIKIMPLRAGGGDQGKVIFIMAHHRHLSQNPPTSVRKIGEIHATNLGQTSGDKPAQIFCSPRACEIKTAEAWQIQHTAIVTDVLSLLLNPSGPWTFAFPTTRGLQSRIIAQMGKPIGPLPAIISPHDSTCSNHLFMHR